MNSQLDPIIAGKLDDFRVRRRNLILLRGLCSGVLSFLGAFVLIAVIDYFTQGRISTDLRTWLSMAGYLGVLVMIWMTCLRPLLQLPSSKKLARLLEQSSPDLQEDLLSAVELGIGKPTAKDSEIFRELVQKQASSKASKLDVKSILPLGKLKHWLNATGGLVILTLVLLQIPNFGSDLKLLMQRAILPGSNLPPVTNFEVLVLAPDKNVTRTPSNEPLRFVAQIKAKRENLSYKTVGLETKSESEQKMVSLTKREKDKFFVDYNVGDKEFHYRIHLDNAPQTEWRKMEVGTRPFVKGFKKIFHFPEYTELNPQEKTENHGDLEAWEGTEIQLTMQLSQPVKSGTIEFQWVEKPEESRILFPEEIGTSLNTSIKMTHPGTYRIKNLVDSTLGWKGRPSSVFEISVKPDLAPSIRWAEPKERDLLVAPNDLLSFSALAEDDLGLARIEYQLKKNQGRWQSFAIPDLVNPRGERSFALNFNLDLLTQKLKPGTQALLKLRAFDLKGSIAETEAIQLSVVSRDFDLRKINTLEKKREIVELFEKTSSGISQMQKELQEILRDFQQRDSGKNALLEKTDQSQNQFSIAGETAYEKSLKALLGMPKGIDSFEASFVANAMGQIYLSSSKSWKQVSSKMERQTERNRIRSLYNDLSKISNERRGMSGNFYNITQDLLNRHAEIIAVSFLEEIIHRQDELIDDWVERKPLAYLARRQQIAVNQWSPIAKTLSYSRDWRRSSLIKKIDAEQAKFQNDSREAPSDRLKLKAEIDAWKSTLGKVLHEAKQKLASKTKDAFHRKPEELYWNLMRNHVLWDRLGKEWVSILQKKPETLEESVKNLQEEMDVLITESMMLSEVEQSKKDQNPLFVRDAGQTGRALIKMQQQIRDFDPEEVVAIEEVASNSSKLEKSFDLLLLQHHLVGSANQVIYFMRQENVQASTWKGAECARQWGRVEAIWKPILESMIRMRISSEAVKIMKSLPNQSYRKNIVQEMNRRFKSERHKVSSKIEDATLVLSDLQRIISLLKDDVHKARSFVNQIAPTIPELARDLASETKSQKEKIEEIGKNEEQTAADKLKSLKRLEEKQQELGNSVENFAQALRQDANVQNLLDDEGREIARDSDDAAAMVEETEREIEEKLSEATQSQNSEEVKESIDQTVDEQEQLIDELNLIAEHFDKLADEKSIAETRAELRSSEEDLELGEQIEKQYAQAEKLADLAQLSPEELLEALEEELEKNQAMQRELSDLAQETVEKAKDQLEDALTEEESLVQKMEEENKDLVNEKRELAKELEALAKETQNLAERNIQPIQEKANQAKAEKTSQKAKQLSESLKEKADEINEVAKQKPDSQELKDAALELADALSEASEKLKDASESLQNQTELTPESAQKQAAKLEEDAQDKQAKADALQLEADQKKADAQQAQQDSLLAKLDEQKAQEKASKAKDDILNAKKLADGAPEDPTLQANLKDARDEFEKHNEDLANAEQKSAEADQKAENMKKEAELAQAKANQAQASANDIQADAAEAEQLANAFANQEEKDSIKQASESGSELSEAAAKEASDLQRKAEAIADALDQLTEDVEGNAEVLADAQEVQNQLDDEIFEVSQELARAARHEERLDNQAMSDLLKDLAESTEETALEQIPETAQALANQALANELQDLAESGQDLAKELSQSSPKEDEGIAEQLAKIAEQSEAILENDPSFSELLEQTESFSEQANEAEDTLANLAESYDSKSETSQEEAEVSAEIASKAKSAMQDAIGEAKEAEDLAQQLEQVANEVNQAFEAGSVTAQETKEALAAAEEASKAAEQLAEVAEAATDDFASAQQKAIADQQTADMASNQAEQAFQQAEAASNLATAAEALLDQFSDLQPSSEFNQAELPGPAMAINEVADQLEQQIEALDNLQFGEPAQSDPGASKQQKGDEPTPGNDSNEASSPTNQELSADESSFESSVPFSDPEVSEVLAQTLDSLDQAIWGNENPLSESSDHPTEQLASTESGKAGQPNGQISDKQPGDNFQTSEAGEPESGNLPGNSGATQQTSMPSANDAISQALQSLQLAAETHAQSMAQQRTRQMMTDAKGNQLNSGEGEYKASPIAEVGDLPVLNEMQNEDSWGKLPPRLAKDLMEAKRERVSENYRNQVQAYFQAMSAKARTVKK